MRKFLILCLSAALVSCSAGPQGGSASESSSASAPDEAARGRAAQAQTPGGPAPVEVSLPKLAYAYTLGFRLPGDRVAAAQEAHRAYCERLGPARCQLLSLTRGSAENSATGASLKLRVASGDARTLTDAFAKAVTDAGGRSVDTNVTAEDVSKAIVDTEARIRQRELLVARLTEILRTRTGKVAELVEAERSVAQAQEELDQTKAWLAELRGRVVMSDVTVNYQAVAPSISAGSAGNQLGDAVTGSASGFVAGLRVLLTLAIYLLPWALLAAPVVWLVRRQRRRQKDLARGTANASDG